MASAALKGVLGPKILNKSGQEVAIESLCGEGKQIGLYFSAHWCPPCRGFTPKLVEWYNTNKAERNLEIIFVSLDRDKHR